MASKPNPNLAKSSKAGPPFQPNFSKNKAWISLDSLVRNEPFQRVIATPRQKNFVRAIPSRSLRAGGAFMRRPVKIVRFSDFRKLNPAIMDWDWFFAIPPPKAIPSGRVML
jgi:hypothetical protein